MILILMSIVALMLFIMSYFLIKKNVFFTSLIGNSEENMKFLKQAGYGYLFLGIVSAIVGLFDNRMMAILYLVILILYSGIFSLSLSKKITSKM